MVPTPYAPPAAAESLQKAGAYGEKRVVPDSLLKHGLRLTAGYQNSPEAKRILAKKEDMYS